MDKTISALGTRLLLGRCWLGALNYRLHIQVGTGSESLDQIEDDAEPGILFACLDVADVVLAISRVGSKLGLRPSLLGSQVLQDGSKCLIESLRFWLSFRWRHLSIISRFSPQLDARSCIDILKGKVILKASFRTTRSLCLV